MRLILQDSKGREMKPATEALPGLVLATRLLAQSDMPYRLVGVLLVVGVTVLF